MDKNRYKVALIGRPNVGKSTLFNKIIGKQMAIVDDRPGVTRDYRQSDTTIQGKAFTFIDTAGLENSKNKASIAARMTQQTEKAIELADFLVFVIDGREGVLPVDEHFARLVRKQKKPKCLVVNKCESLKGNAGIAEAPKLGLGEPLPMSAEHGQGFFELYELLLQEIKDTEQYTEEAEEQTAEKHDIDDIEGNEEYEFVDVYEKENSKKPLKVAIVGRPNVGKSTLVNAFLDEERVMTGPEAGVTRDAIAIDWVYNGRPFKLVDTAGLRKKSKVVDNIEKQANDDSFRAIRLAQMVVLVVDGTLGMDKQDIQIAAHAVEEGRGLILALNKWDAVEDKEKTLEEIKYRLEVSLGQIKDIPIQTISALNGRNITKLIDRLLDLYNIWNAHVGTGKLNRWLEAKTAHHPPPLVRGKANKLRYMAQINTRPPTFALWMSQPKALPESYKRYLTNALREDFDIAGVPIRLLLRKSKNPYSSK